MAKDEAAEIEIASTGALRIVQEAVRPDCSVHELAELAAADPGFALRALSMVNSSAFGLRSQVSDVRHAASLLGVRGLRNIALSLVVGDLAPMGEEGAALLACSLRRAVAARSVAQSMGLPDRDAHFTTGLFLESGLLVLAGRDLPLAGRIAAGPAGLRLLSERAAGVTAHPESGASLAARFTLPSETIEAIRAHHDDEPGESDVAKVAWAAERVAAVFEAGAVQGAKEAAVEAAARVGVSAEDLEKILGALPEQVSELADAFARQIGEQPDIEALTLDANRSLAAMNNQYEGLVRTLEAVIVEKERLAKELEEANTQLLELATTDALTSLPNKRALLDSLRRDLARADREGQPLGLVMIDVDHFKLFNDTWGHATGDEVLRVVGRVLRETIRTGDMAARYGGEEFTLVLPGTDEKGGLIVAERVRERLAAATIDGPEGPLSVTASFGLATVCGPGCRTAVRDLFARADAALYDAKRAGRNRVQMAA